MKQEDVKLGVSTLVGMNREIEELKEKITKLEVQKGKPETKKEK